jgi:parvulin-like peptidyl-prolyl isomerase
MKGRSERAVLPLLAIAAALLTFSACGEPPPEDPVILQIGGQGVPLSAFEAYLQAVGEDEVPLAGAELQSALLDQFIEEQLLLRAAKEEGIVVESQEVAELEERLAASFGSEEPVELEPRSGSADAGARLSRSDLATHLMLKKLMGERVLSGVTADDEEIAAYYEENRAYYKRPGAVDISQILVETEEEAGELLKKAGVKKSQFEELAREHSIGPEAVDGGHLGVFQRGELPVSFETEVFGLRKGKVSKVVHTDFGYHIFRVNEVYPARDLSLTEVEETIKVCGNASLSSSTWNSWIFRIWIDRLSVASRQTPVNSE